MASGMGVRGTVGRCYGYFADFKQCQQESREAKAVADDKCYQSREDYFECLHSRKQNARIAAVAEEHNRQNKGGSIAKMIRERKGEE